MTPARVETLGVDPTGGAIYVLLRADTGRILPIVIGPLEGQHIMVALAGETPPRPLLPDLMLSTLDFLGARLLRVEVSDLKGGTFYARIVLDHRGVEHEVDGRPSDAIALALRANAPILVDDRVLAEAGVEGPEGRTPGGKIPEA